MIRLRFAFPAVFSVVLFSSCATFHSLPQFVDRSPSPYREIAAEENVAPPADLVWVPHPCPQFKGIPFRKYQAFALDKTNGNFFARLSEKEQGIKQNLKPNGKNAYETVEEFLEDKGITKACALVQANPDISPAPAPPSSSKKSKPRDAQVPPGQVYQAPIELDVHLYYQPLFDDTTTGRSLKAKMTNFLSKPHLQKVQAADQVVEDCPATLEEGQVCVSPKIWSYKNAREEMFGNIDLRQRGDGKYEVFDYYCQQWRGEEEFVDAAKKDAKGDPEKEQEELLAPHHIISALVMNAEHSWPQSKFTDAVGQVLTLKEKTDLHHIFSTDSKVNNIRANNEFAEVDPASAKTMHCADGKSGTALPVQGASDGTEVTFEPPKGMKGAVARALFYFAARFNAGMSRQQEFYLRKWNRENPPDAQERERNEKIYQLIGTRNPFVDSPALADRIERFCREKLDKDQASQNFDCAATPTEAAP